MEDNTMTEKTELKAERVQEELEEARGTDWASADATAVRALERRVAALLKRARDEAEADLSSALHRRPAAAGAS